MAMVEIFLSAFITVLFEKLSSGDLLSFARREGIHSLVKRWSVTLAQIQAVVDDAEEKQIGDGAVGLWMEDLRDLAYDLDDILDDFAYEDLRHKLNTPAQHHHQASTSRSSKVMAFMPTCCTNFNPSTLFSDRRMKSKIDDITSRLLAISEQRKQLGLEKVSSASASTKPWKSPPISSSLMSEPRVYGRDNDKREIIDFLLKEEEISTHNSSFGVIPIVGMGGLGKTTLAQMVYNDEIVNQHFDLKAWVCVSDDFDILRITKAILEFVTPQGGEFKELGKVQVQLKQNLAGKKFLIVLDDVWDKKYHDWNVLKSPFNDGAPGSKVIVTTRNRDVGLMMGTVPCRDLQCLSHDDCWFVFAHHAFGNRTINENLNLVSIGQKIVVKCGGLPLAARTLGGLLRCKEREDDWEHVLNSKIWDLDSEINPALRLSYHHLSPHLKQCFAYCSLLPKDYEFEEQELVLMWMAEGFIRQTKGQQQMEYVGGECFRELLSRSFFQPSNKSESKKFVMHDLINDLAQVVARHTCFRLEDYLKDHKQYENLKKARHSSHMQDRCNGMKKFEIFYKTEHLRTFVRFPLWEYEECFLTSKVPLDLLPRLRCLRVLNLRRYYIHEIENSIGALKHLRYLDLSYSKIKLLPESVGTLNNLQTLMLEGCRDLEKLPTDMGNLINLRHLNIGDSNSLEEMPMGINKLTNLQTLSQFIISKGNGSRIKELGNLIHLKGELRIKGLQHVMDPQDARGACLNDKKGLDVLLMEWSDNSDAKEAVDRDASRNDMVEIEVLRSLQPHGNLKKLIIKRFYGSKFPDWIGDSLFTKMVDISLEDCKNCTSLPPLGKLPSLRMLNIQGMNAIRHVGREFYGEDCNKFFPLLETLSFVNMQEWEEWFTCAVDMEVQIFTSVSELSIKECPKLLGTLPSTFPSLRIVEITNCPQLSIRGSNLVLPSLASLSITSLQIPSLPTLRIDMTNMPESSSLTSMKMKDIQFPESLCNPSIANEAAKLGNTMLKHLNSVNSLSLVNIQKLAFLPKWLTQGLMELKELKIVRCQELTTLWKNEVRLPALQKLKIRGCPQFVSLFEEKEAQGLICCMPRLEHLKIRSCEKLEKLPQGLLDTSLRKLSLNDCMSLEFIFGWVRENDNDNINLQELSVKKCPSLRYLINRGGLPPTLKHLEIGYCCKLEALLAEEGMKINCPSLEDINIWSCENLKYLPDVLHNNNLRNLEILSITYCKNLELVPEGWIHPTSSNMRQLELQRCEKLEVLPAHFLQKNILTSLEGLWTVSCSGFLDKANFLTNLTSLSIDNSKIGKSPSEWGLHRFSSLTRLIISCVEESNSFPSDGMLLPTSLIFLNILYFPNLEKLSSDGFQNLASLESLSLQHCPRLASLPKKGLPPSLLCFLINRCPILEQRCERGKGQYWPLIAHIPKVRIRERII